MEHLELNKKQRQFITDRFLDGDSLLGYVQQFDDKGNKVDCSITHPGKGWIMINEDYLCDVVWSASCTTGVEIEFSMLRHPRLDKCLSL